MSVEIEPLGPLAVQLSVSFRVAFVVSWVALVSMPDMSSTPPLPIVAAPLGPVTEPVPCESACMRTVVAGS